MFFFNLRNLKVNRPSLVTFFYLTNFLLNILHGQKFRQKNRSYGLGDPWP